MANAYQADMTGRPKSSPVKRAIVIVLLTIVMIAAAVFGSFWILLRGPSAYAGGLFAERVKDIPVIGSVMEIIAGDAAFSSESGQQSYSIYPQID